MEGIKYFLHALYGKKEIEFCDATALAVRMTAMEISRPI